MKSLAPNTLVQNRYLIIQLIGKGGMGEVYLAVDQRLGSAIALKRTFFTDDEMLAGAFEREARTLARLRHPVLPKVSDHFMDQGSQYLVMEHITGDDLSQRLKATNKAFPLNWVLFWADQLLDALNYLHTNEPPIIHRDIKPQNLKLTDNNHVVLLDFGLAKNTLEQTRMSSGSISGYTPHYAPMEQIRGTGTTPKSDIYSLSATLYQLLTAQVPADALSRADVVLNSKPDPVVSLSEINAEVPVAVSAVIMKGMSLSADQRYETAREMQSALRAAYSELQQATSAETVALKAPGADEGTGAQTQKPTEQLNMAEISQPIVSGTAAEEAGAAKTVQFSADSVADQAGQVVPEEIAGAKTEVMPEAELVGAKTTIMPEVAAPETPTEVIPEVVAPVTESMPAAEQKTEVMSEAVMPTEALQPEVREGDSVPTRVASNVVIPVGDQGKKPADSAPPAYQTPPVEKSGGMGKTLGILAAILLVGVVLAGAGVGGWYYMNLNSTTTTPTPMPSAEPTVAPSTVPSVEPTLQAEANSNSNANTAGTPDSELTTGQTPVPGETKPGGDATPQRTPKTVVTSNTPKPQPTKSAAPTKKPAGDRTDILQ